MAIADFFKVKILMTVLLNHLGLGTCWVQHFLSQVISTPQLAKNGASYFYVAIICFYSIQKRLRWIVNLKLSGNIWEKCGWDLEGCTCVWAFMIGDGATIKQTPLLNMLVMCGNYPPTVMSIFDCTEHMSASGMKMQHLLQSDSKRRFMKLMQQLNWLTALLMVLSIWNSWCNPMCRFSIGNVFSLWWTCFVSFFSDPYKLKPIQVSYFFVFPIHVSADTCAEVL